MEACEKLGVETKPSMVDGVGIIPLYSWYHEVEICLIINNAAALNFDMDLNRLFIFIVRCMDFFCLEL